MKIRYLLAIEGLAFSFVLPAVAQQKDTVDPQIAQEIRELTMKYEDALNEHDAEATAGSSLRMRCGQRHREHFMVAVRLSESSQITIFGDGILRTRSLLSIG